MFGNGAVTGAGIVGALVWLCLYRRLVFLLGIIGASLPNKLKNLTLNEKSRIDNSGIVW